MILEARRAVLPDGHGGLEVVPARLVLEGARIASVERCPTTPTPPDADDLGDLLLTPAFVNAHTHLALVSLRGAVGEATGGNVVEDLFFRVERRLTPGDVRALTVVGAYECLLSGTAAVWDHYFFADAVLAALRDAGLAGVVTEPLQDLAGPAEDRWEAGLDTIARLAGDPTLAANGLGVCVGPHATDTVSDALWGRVATLAGRLGLPVHVHVAQSLDEVERAHARAGTTPLGILRRLGVLDAGAGWLLVHGLFLSRDDLAALDPARHTLIACPSAQALFGFPAPWWRWELAGRPWAVASDASASNDAMDVRSELRAVAALRTQGAPWSDAHARWHEGGAIADARAAWEVRQASQHALAALADPVAMLHRVWTLPGRLHPHLPCGELRAGALAHLALWDTDHPSMWPGDDPLRALAFGSCSGALAQVMTAGRWRGERGDLRRSLLAEPAWLEAREEARARRARLLDPRRS